MGNAIERLVEAYPDQDFVYATTKEDALEYIERIADEIRSLEEFSRFPEGPRGVVIYAMFLEVARICPDADDLGQFRQGFEQILRHSFR